MVSYLTADFFEIKGSIVSIKHILFVEAVVGMFAGWTASRRESTGPYNQSCIARHRSPAPEAQMTLSAFGYHVSCSRITPGSVCLLSIVKEIRRIFVLSG